ncbi:serine hydrolase domain-containing protein [Paenisporosarcina sp. NPDC076898]|uniref:serine hydrolase domain-containing protein n=1 Tax=unclassified Paenisporosarcina TaxID=2642018 RepID=UPI003D0675BC
MKNTMTERITSMHNENDFSGSVLVLESEKVLIDCSFGYANRAEKINNQSGTRYGIASGCKLFTAIAICQLVEERKLSFEAKLTDCLDVKFPQFDDNVTVHHLLTHTSGVPDYFDEEVMDDFEELWIKTPMYHIRNLQDFLPLFQNEPMKNSPGKIFRYNNSGYILLGLIVEQASGLSFTDYVEEHIFKKVGMIESGYFAFDSLPEKTALGYIDHKDGTWKTNIYSLPAKGGSDGGAYVTITDMARLWQSLTNNQILSKEMTDCLLTAHVQTKENSFYGYGIWINKEDVDVVKYHVMGYDPGVSFHSAYYPKDSRIVVVCSNKSSGAYKIMNAIEEEWIKVLNR